MKMRKSLACCRRQPRQYPFWPDAVPQEEAHPEAMNRSLFTPMPMMKRLRPSKTPWTPMVMKENTSYRASAPLSSAENCWQRGKNLEADLVTMSTFYLQSAQDANSMFLPLDFEVNTLEEFPDYCAPITSQEGAILLNTELMEQEGLPRPPASRILLLQYMKASWLLPTSNPLPQRGC